MVEAFNSGVTSLLLPQEVVEIMIFSSMLFGMVVFVIRSFQDIYHSLQCPDEDLDSFSDYF